MQEPVHKIAHKTLVNPSMILGNPRIKMLENDGVIKVRSLGATSKIAYFKDFFLERMNATQSERCKRTFGIPLVENSTSKIVNY